MDEQPSLGQLIWLVRRELEWAHEVDADQPLRFDVGTVELNVDVEATRVRKGEAGLDLKVVAFGGGKAGPKRFRPRLTLERMMMLGCLLGRWIPNRHRRGHDLPLLLLRVTPGVCGGRVGVD